MSRKRTVVLISGRGSNMTALIAAASDPAYPAEIVGVISDRANAAGLAIAQARGIPTKVIVRADYASKEAHDGAIDAALIGFGAEIVALAGYMRILGARFVEKWLGRMVNIHPALLPAFKGLDTHARALRAGMRIHGCTVHFVTLDMDDGPIIAQAAVPVMVGDNERIRWPRGCSRPSTGSIRWRSDWSPKARRAWRRATPCSRISPTMRRTAPRW